MLTQAARGLTADDDPEIRAPRHNLTSKKTDEKKRSSGFKAQCSPGPFDVDDCRCQKTFISCIQSFIHLLLPSFS